MWGWVENIKRKHDEKKAAERAKIEEKRIEENSRKFIHAHGQAVLDLVTRKESLFSKKDLTRMVSGYNGKIKVDDALAEGIADRLLKNKHEVVAYGVQREGQKLFSTLDARYSEERMFQEAKRLHRFDFAPKIDEKIIAGAVEGMAENARQNGFEPSQEQMSAVQKILEPGQLKLLEGPPGAGKTPIAEVVATAVKQQAEKDGKQGQIVATAVSAKAAAQLGLDAKVPAMSIRELTDDMRKPKGEKVKSGATILVDEAGMMSTRQMEVLLKLADMNSSKLVLIGDSAQIPSAEAGQPFRVMTENLETIRLSTSRRQKDAQDRAATHELRDGSPLKALESYDQRGKIAFSENGESTLRQVAQDYAAWRSTPAAKDQSSVVLTNTSEDAKAANAVIREEMKANGLLGKEGRVFTPDGKAEFAVGERMIVMDNMIGAQVAHGDSPVQSESPKAKVPRGSVGTVVGITDNSVSLRLDEGVETLKNYNAAAGEKSKDGTIVALNTDGYPDLRHAYAMGLRDAQGMTVDKSFVAITGKVNRAETLVAFTRHKHDTQAVVNKSVYKDVQALAHDSTKSANKLMNLDITMGAAYAHTMLGKGGRSA
jgi:ATP-dependent exoDNAse (exonuclease V) alpha subunit